jgi:hypothetical protein
MTKSEHKNRKSLAELPAPQRAEAMAIIDEGKPKRNGGSPPAPMPEPMVPQNFRLPQGMVDELERRTSANKLNRVKPATRQDLLIAALQEYFERHPRE